MPIQPSFYPRPCIGTPELRKLGVFTKSGEGCHVFRFGVQPGSSDPLQVRVRWNAVAKAVKLLIKIDDDLFEQEFSVAVSISGLVEKFYFICSDTGVRVTQLYYIDGSFGSRHAKNMRYYYGDSPQPRFDTPRIARNRTPRFDETPSAVLARRKNLDTRAALRRGKPEMRHEGPEWFEEEVYPYLLEYGRRHQRDRLGPEVPMEIWEDHPRLDLRTLIRNRLVVPGKFLAGELAWGDPRLQRAMVYSDLRDMRAARLYLDLDLPKLATGYQVIDLMRQGEHKRLYMKSRDCGLVRVMAFREGYFGALKEQRLIHASQRGRSKAP
jgi:hypothetical protein